MATYYVDPNRGSNTSPYDTWEKAATSLAFMSSATFSAGDTVVIAMDADINGASTTAAVAVMTAADTGSAGSPVLVTADIPTGSGIASGYPIIRNYREPADGDWTWDATKNGWWIGSSASDTVWVRFGGVDTRLAPQIPVHGDGLPLAADRETYNESGKLYVYTPTNATSPSAYYGSIEIGVRNVFSIANASYWEFEGLEFRNLGCAVSLLSPVAALSNIVIRECRLNDAACLLRAYGTAGNTISALTVKDCQIEWAAIPVYISTDCSGINVFNNTFTGIGRHSEAQAGIYIYAGSAINTNARIYNNTFTDVLYGTGNRGYVEGSCFYFDVGAANNRAWGNRMLGGHYLFQDNSGGENWVYGNLAIGDALCRGNDGSAIGARNLHLWHNTLVAASTSDYAADPSQAAAHLVQITAVSGPLDADGNILLSEAGHTSCISITNVGETYTAERNCLHGSTNAIIKNNSAESVSATNVQADPGLNADYRATLATCLKAGQWKAGMRMLDDLPAPLNPDMGAVQDREAAGRRFGTEGGTL